MTELDAVVATPARSDDAERAERSLAEQLVERARADGVDLVGPGGLLAGLTKQVLEAGLEVEMDEHPGYEKHAVEGGNRGNSRNGTRSKTVLTEIGPSRSTCRGIATVASTRRPSASTNAGWTASTRRSSH
jgi:hypothetical protein